MKYLPLALVLSTAPAFASTTQTAIQKINQRLETINQQMHATGKNEVQIPWKIVDEREARFWQAVTAGYDHLMANRQTERYNFLYEASRAYSQGHPQRITALQTWLKTENKRIYALGLSYKFYDNWKPIAAKISQSIDELAQPRPTVEAKSDARGVLVESKVFLERLKQELSSIPAVAPAPVAAPVIATHDIETRSLEQILLAFTALTGFAFAVAYFRGKKNTKPKKNIAKSALVEEVIPPLPELPSEVEQAFDNDPVMAGPAVNLEDECRKVLKESSDLLELSQVKVNLDTRSPFKTTVHSSEEKVTEALKWLVKGAVAVANTAKAPVTHLDWKCKEHNGRVSLEFILHGVEVDSRQLYQNAVLDGDGSACAHFGRTENALSGHQPVVAYRIGNKKTTISLGLENYRNELSH